MYIGHTTLETFMQHVSAQQPLYLNLLEELIPGSKGIGLIRCYLLLQTATATDQATPTVHYWRMMIGEVLAPGAIPWEQQYAALRKRGLSAHAAIKQWLTAQKTSRCIEDGAVISMPRDLRLVSGSTVLLAFDKASGLFRLATSEAGADMSPMQKRLNAASLAAIGSCS